MRGVVTSLKSKVHFVVADTHSLPAMEILHHRREVKLEGPQRHQADKLEAVQGAYFAQRASLTVDTVVSDHMVGERRCKECSVELVNTLLQTSR